MVVVVVVVVIVVVFILFIIFKSELWRWIFGFSMIFGSLGVDFCFCLDLRWLWVVGYVGVVCSQTERERERERVKK